jgi:predicted RNA binding protein YcfA (HicA-like mRNA interferase family)
MLKDSKDIKRRLEKDGWQLSRTTGSHHVFKHCHKCETIVLPHPKKDLGPGLVATLYKQAGWPKD